MLEKSFDIVCKVERERKREYASKPILKGFNFNDKFSYLI